MHLITCLILSLCAFRQVTWGKKTNRCPFYSLSKRCFLGPPGSRLRKCPWQPWLDSTQSSSKANAVFFKLSCPPLSFCWEKAWHQGEKRKLHGWPDLACQLRNMRQKAKACLWSISFLQRLGQCCCFTFQADTIFIKGYLNLIWQDADIGKRERKEGEH